MLLHALLESQTMEILYFDGNKEVFMLLDMKSITVLS